MWGNSHLCGRDGMNKQLQGHLMALAAVLIWGMTFISSKVLVGLLDPYWYIVIRFGMAWFFLFLFSPKPLKLLDKKTEGTVVLCGIAGVTAYYIFQNVALIHSTASNTGVITASSPLFTALILWAFGRRVKLSPLFFLGFVLCIGGVFAISFNGGGTGLHLLGDTFALAAAIAWGVYCVLILGTEGAGLTESQTTRKVFFWGTLITVPFALVLGEPVPLTTFTRTVPLTIFYCLFFSNHACALCLAFSRIFR